MLISSMKWSPRIKYRFSVPLNRNLYNNYNDYYNYNNNEQSSLITFEQRKKITYLGVLVMIVYVIYLSSAFPQESLTWDSYVKKLLNLPDLS
jgi:hypothetical protein